MKEKESESATESERMKLSWRKHRKSFIHRMHAPCERRGQIDKHGHSCGHNRCHTCQLPHRRMEQKIPLSFGFFFFHRLHFGRQWTRTTQNPPKNRRFVKANFSVCFFTWIWERNKNNKRPKKIKWKRKTESFYEAMCCVCVWDSLFLSLCL